MRRKAAPGKQRPWQDYQVRKDISKDRLAAFGAVALLWNDIEGAIDTTLGLALELPEPMWIEITSRINGLDGKIAIIKRAAKIIHKLPDETLNVLAETFGTIEQHKKYRDGIAHARIAHPDAPVAATAQRKGIEDEVLVSKEALDALCARLEAVQSEMNVVMFIFHFKGVLRVSPDSSSKERELVERELQSSRPQLQNLQRSRQRLPLPKFPVET